MLTLAHVFAAATDILLLWALFDRFSVVDGWTLKELALMYGIVHMGFASAEMMGRGFDKFGRMVRSGDFDRLLLRPVGTLFQVATSEFLFTKCGRFFQGLLVFVWGATTLNLSFIETAFFLLPFLGTTALFYGIFVFQATSTFWLRETTELMNILTYGGRASGQFPITIFHYAWRFFFTYIIPMACVLYYPIATFLHHENFPLWVALATPCAGFLFLFVSFQCWKIGVRHYHSTGN